MSDSTRLIDIYRHLKGKGIEVYFPTQKIGECTSPYVVVRDAGTNPYMGFSTTLTTYGVMCYVPKNQYSQLRVYTDQVKEAMWELKPMIMPLNIETPPFFDETVKAHMTEVQYRNARYVPG